MIFYEYTYTAINQYFCSRNINIGMKKILFTISLTFLAGYAIAQETMSLGRCLQMGIERNLNLKTYEGNVLKGKHNVSENRSRLLPQINRDCRLILSVVDA